MAPYPGYQPVHEPFLGKIVDVGWPRRRRTVYLFIRVDMGNVWSIERPNPLPIPPYGQFGWTMRGDFHPEIDRYDVPSVVIYGHQCMQYLPVQQGVVDYKFGPGGKLEWVFGPVGYPSADEAYAIGRAGKGGDWVKFYGSTNGSCPFVPSGGDLEADGSYIQASGSIGDWYVYMTTIPINYFGNTGWAIQLLFEVTPG